MAIRISPERAHKLGLIDYRDAIIQDANNDAHDPFVRGLSGETLLAAAKDLGARPMTMKRDPEARWTRERYAALGREISRRRRPCQPT